jgi:dipeptidyl aminopeptidase/acylaminoacyl peptidase
MNSARVVSLLVAVWLSSSAVAQPPSLDAGVPTGPQPLIARELLFGNPERLSPQLAPDGRRLAWLQPDAQNVLQLKVRTVGALDDATVSADRKRGIRTFSWAEDSNTLLYSQDQDGDENFHLFAIDLSTRNVRDLTPWQGVRAELLEVSERAPDTVLFTANVRDRKQMDVWKVSLKTGATELDTQNPGDVTTWVVDANLLVRGALATTTDGGSELRVRDVAKGPWRALITVGPEETIAPYFFTLDGKSLVLETSIDGDTSRVVEKLLKSGTERVIAQNEKSDPVDTLVFERQRVLRAVAFSVDGRPQWTFVDGIRSEFETMAKSVGDATLRLVSADKRDALWVMSSSGPTQPMKYWLWERKTKKLTPLFSTRSQLEGLALAEMKPVTIAARDGLALTAYLTTPVGVEPKKLPLVVLVHGGPWARDEWDFDARAQWLSNRGYAVLQVNFRGSTGAGKRFLNAGNKQWGLAMQNDLVDAAQWAVDQGVADATKVAVMGGSYGGYATLMSLVSTPERWRCGIDLVGPSNLFTLMATVPPYWESMRRMFARRIGDVNDPADKELLTRASPLFSADKLRAPLLIGQGANDPRVKVAEAEQVVAALEKNGKGVTYALYPDEGHGFARPENRLDFNARAESFLNACLGGRAEPMPREGRVPGSTVVVKVVPAKK